MIIESLSSSAVILTPTLLLMRELLIIYLYYLPTLIAFTVKRCDKITSVRIRTFVAALHIKRLKVGNRFYRK